MTAKKINNRKKKSRKAASSRKGFWLRSMREGTPLSIDFFKRHAWFILIAMVVVIALIGQRYTNKSKMREIRELTKELVFEKAGI